MTDREAGAADRFLPESPLVGGQDGMPAVRLVRRAAAGPDGEPFVVLHEGRFSRVLLAELVDEAGRPLQRVAWKVRRDAVGPPATAGSAVTNGAVDAMWARERAELARVRSPQVLGPVPVPPGLLASPSVWYCRRREVCFHPPSPASGGPLRVCRDDALLTRHGLPPYALAGERLLYDGSAGAPPVFYRASAGADVDSLPGGAVVGSARQLVRDLARLVHAPVGNAAADLPCVTCEHRRTCYPEAAAGATVPAEQELHVVSFHEVEAEALELREFDLGEAIALLGGADVEAVLAARLPGRAEAVPAATVARLAQGPQWLFAADPQRLVREVLRQKLGLFLEVCEGLAAVHATGRPHLALAPAHVLVSFGLAPGAPVRWQARAALADLGSATPVALPDAAARFAVGTLLEPGADMRDDARCRAYLAPALAGLDADHQRLPVACWQTGHPDGLVRFVVEAQGAGVARSCRAGDLVIVQPAAGGPRLVACLEEVRPRGLLASALLPANDPCLQWDGKQFEAVVSFHRRLGPAADLHGLGLLLLHALCVNDRQDFAEVAEAMARVLRRLEDEPTAVRVEERPALARLQQLLHAAEQRGRFEALHVLHRAADRDAVSRSSPAGEAALEPALHDRLLAVVARAMATWAPFAYAATLAEGSAAPLQQLVADVTAVVRRLDVELFDAARRDAAVLAACAECADGLRAQPRAAGPAAAPRPAVPGFRLLQTRDGDPQGQELRYEVPRVTIGRREGENLLRLNDPMVSSLHAVIEFATEGWVVFDRNSTNGTEVDGIRLPVEVPQPLQDGSVLVIRPFRFVFHALRAPADAAVGAPEPAGALRERLHEAFAKAGGGAAVAVHEALLAVLRAAVAASPPGQLLPQLDELLRTAPASPPAVGERGLQEVSARALQQLSRSLLGVAEFATAEQIQQFVGKLGRFIDTTAHWMERVLELRKVLGKHLDLGASSTGANRPSVRTAADVRALVAGWGAEAPPPEASAYYVAKFYDDIVAILVGLLEGNQQIRKAVRERLDPARLVDQAGRDAALRLLVQAAASSPLWKLYVQTFLEVTGGGAEQEAQLAQLVQKVTAP